jgi:pyrimidine operon attenuation protein/uracil phosphoribosyltransferase
MYLQFMSHARVILETKAFQLTLNRLALELIENHKDFQNTVIIGLQPRGVSLSKRLVAIIKNLSQFDVTHGEIDATFHRDDFRQKSLIPSATHIEFNIDGKNVVLVDDVLYTGRSVRSTLDALISFGRPKKTELLVLVDRRFSREVPVQPDYIGIRVDAIQSEKVKVNWQIDDENSEDLIFIEAKPTS